MLSATRRACAPTPEQRSLTSTPLNTTRRARQQQPSSGPSCLPPGRGPGRAVPSCHAPLAAPVMGPAGAHHLKFFLRLRRADGWFVRLSGLRPQQASSYQDRPAGYTLGELKHRINRNVPNLDEFDSIIGSPTPMELAQLEAVVTSSPARKHNSNVRDQNGSRRQGAGKSTVISEQPGRPQRKRNSVKLYDPSN